MPSVNFTGLYSFIEKGGRWLGAARNWMQCNIPRGDTLTWGSGVMVNLPFYRLEDLSRRVANAAVESFISNELIPVAAQYRYVDPEEGPSIWIDCSLADAAIYKSKQLSYEVRYTYILSGRVSEFVRAL